MLEDHISNYRIVRKIADGGMGVVYEAEDTRLGRTVALKVISDDLSRDPSALERFHREARAASALNHPGICTIYEIGEDHGRPYLAMEYLQGQTLREYVRSGPAPIETVLELGYQLADALEAAHNSGVLHRDIKPANILLTSRGTAKLLDFGLAKLQHASAATTAGASTDLTTSGVTLGTAAYMSPEQALGRDLDARSDIFSLGCVLYELATGHAPFAGPTPAAIYNAILTKVPTSPMRLRPEIPAELDRIISKCLEKDRDLRYQSAAELRVDLKRARRDSDPFLMTTERLPLARPPKTQHKGNRRFVAAVAALFVVAITAAIAWRTFSSKPPRVTAIQQITRDGLAKAMIVTDGVRIYFGQSSSFGKFQLSQVSVRGGETAPLSPQSAIPQSLSPDHSQLLILSSESYVRDAKLGVLGLPAGDVRPVGDVKAASAVWTADGQYILYSIGNEIIRAKPDGTEQSRIYAGALPVSYLRISPDGKRLRFTAGDSQYNTFALWEVRIDGSHAHPLLPDWHKPARECCGIWTADGKLYIFQDVGPNNASNLWAMAGDSSGFGNNGAPVQLTNGPLHFMSPFTPPSGRNVYTIGLQTRGELVRYDTKIGEFLPYLDALPATDVAFSKDGQWVAYTRMDDGTLWRSRLDGTERLQLTSSDMQIALPRWSPDGKSIVFSGVTLGRPWKIFRIAATGGNPEEMSSENQNEMDASYSPDGSHIIFGRLLTSAAPEKQAIFLLDVNTREITELPGSDKLFSPRWSPDGKWIAAITVPDMHTLMLYDVAKKKWSEWCTIPEVVTYPSWSPDSQWIHFDKVISNQPGYNRLKLGEHTPKQMFESKRLRRYQGSLGIWSGQSPDGSPLFVRDISTQEIYSLSLDY